MGFPVNNIKNFEEHIKHNSSNKMALVIMANAYSESKAVELVSRNFELLDTLSDEVYFYLPGYHVIGREVVNGNPMFEDEWFRENEKREFMDSHIPNIHTVCVNSRRLGRISFNEAAFADFAMEFTHKINGYVYLGCQMILIPINSGRYLEYNDAKVYDLDKIVNEPGGTSLDTFIYSTFHILRNDDMSRYRNTITNHFLGKTEMSTLEKLDQLYNDSIKTRYHEDRYEIVIRNVIIDMERWLNWHLYEEFYFISYSTNNVMYAEYLKSFMQTRKLRVWIAPDGIPQGRDYSQTVPTAIKHAKHFILILTEDSANSRWVMRELDVAISNEHQMKVKILLADGYTIEKMRSNLELSFYLNKIQIHFFYDDIIHDEEMFRRFIL